MPKSSGNSRGKCQDFWNQFQQSRSSRSNQEVKVEATDSLSSTGKTGTANSTCDPELTTAQLPRMDTAEDLQANRTAASRELADKQLRMLFELRTRNLETKLADEQEKREAAEKKCTALQEQVGDIVGESFWVGSAVADAEDCFWTEPWCNMAIRSRWPLGSVCTWGKWTYEPSIPQVR